MGSRIDFSTYISERTRDFTGREWLFAEIDQWLDQTDGSSVFILTGEPGIGKSAFAARLTQRRPAAASHFCIARRVETLDPFGFVRSLAAQLSEVKGFAKAILREGEVHIDVHQQTETNVGEMVGVNIGQLVLNAPSATVAFNWAVITPLCKLAAAYSAAPLLIVVDGLDEALQFPGRMENIVQLLAGADLPAPVRLLMTTRPEKAVLGYFERANAPVRLLNAAQSENMDDARNYVRQRVKASAKLRGRLTSAGVAQDDFAVRAANASKGNFLYLNWLLPAVAKGDQSPHSEASFPTGLDSIYREFLRTRVVGRYRREWRRLYRPLLGVLAATQAPLDTAQLVRFSGLSKQDVADALVDVGQFLEPTALDEGRYQLYHQSLVDFLRNRERAEEFWIDLVAVHGQITGAYLQQDALNWSKADDYGLRHLPLHLQHAGQIDTLQQLLLDYCWLQAKLAATDVASLLSDYKLLEALDGPLGLVYEALKKSADVLAREPDQLRSQLWGRLADRPEAGIQSLLQQATADTGFWLRPLYRSLTPPGSPLLLTFAGHKAPVETVTVTPDGQLALSGCRDKIVKVWKVENGQEVTTFTGHAAKVNAVAVTPDGRFALSASDDNTIKKWGIEDGQRTLTFAGHEGSVTVVTITADGKLVLSASNDMTVRVWMVDTGDHVMTFTGHTDKINSVAVTPDGKFALSASEDKTVKVWEIESGREIVSFEDHDFAVTAVTVMPDGVRAISASWDKTIKMWEVRSGRVLASFAEDGYGATLITVTPDGKLAISSSESETVKIWEIDTGAEVQLLRGHSMPVSEVTVTSDGSLALSASWDRSVKVWHIELDQAVADPVGHESSIFATTVTPDGRLLLSAAADGTVKVWDIESWQEVSTFKGHSSGVNAIAVTPNGELALSASWDKAVKAWEIDSGREAITFTGHSEEVYTVTVTPDGSSVLSGGADNMVRVWDIQSAREMMSLKGHGGQVNALTVTPDAKLALSASNDKTIKVWELSSGREVATFNGHTDKVYALAVSPNGQFAISGSVDKSVKIWEIESGREVIAFRGHSGPVYAVAVTSDGQLVISASGDETIQVWELGTGQKLATFNANDHVSACAAIMGTRKFVAGDWLGRIHFLRLDDGPL